MNGTSQALNAVIAMLEDRPALFKELLRAPGSNVKDLTSAEQRLRRAMCRYAATQIKVGLMQTLHVLPPDSGPEYQEGFLNGVRAIEGVFEALAKTLEK